MTVFIRMICAAIGSAIASGSSVAVAANCAPIIEATEKSAQQPARHSITELGGNQTLEAIIVDGVMYSKMGESWRKLKTDFGAAEAKIIAQMRSGEIELKDCAVLGKEQFDGRQTTVYQYRALMPGAQGLGDELAKLYVGADGLIYGLSSDGTTMRQRYTDVTIPLP